MKFGFNDISDEAKDKLVQSGARFYKQDTQWIVETEAYDQHENEFQRLKDEYSLEIPTPRELKEEYKRQGTRIWKHPDTGTYYYLIGGSVFRMNNIPFSDYSVYPPTTHVVSVLEWVPKEDQIFWKDILVQRPPNANQEGGGVLI